MRDALHTIPYVVLVAALAVVVSEVLRALGPDVCGLLFGMVIFVLVLVLLWIGFGFARAFIEWRTGGSG